MNKTAKALRLYTHTHTLAFLVNKIGSKEEVESTEM